MGLGHGGTGRGVCCCAGGSTRWWALREAWEEALLPGMAQHQPCHQRVPLDPKEQLYGDGGHQVLS